MGCFQLVIIFLLFILTLVKGEVKLDVYGTGCLYTAAFECNFGCEGYDLYSLAPCICTNPAFLQTVVGCIELNTQISAEKEQAYKTFQATCFPQVYPVDYISLIQNVKTLPTNVPQAELMTPHSEGFIIPQETLQRSFKATSNVVKQRHHTTYYGAAMIGYFAIVILLRTITNSCYKFIPSVLYLFDFKIMRAFRQKLLLPATGSHHHSNPLSVGIFTFIIPTRFETIVIAGFMILNIILLFVDIPLVMPNIMYPTERVQYSMYLLNRAGIITLSEFTILMLFAGRNNFLIWLTGWNLSDFNVFHKWIARTILFNVVVHAAAATVNGIQTTFYFIAWQDGWFCWGVAAGILMFFASLFATHFLRSRGYEIFLALHIVLVAVIMVGTYYHVKVQIDGIQYVYAMIGIWGYDYVARFSRILFSGIKSTAQARVVGGDIIEFKINYSGRWKFYPGSYAFIHILLPLQKSWQSHPFSLITSPVAEDYGKLVILARIKGGITKSTCNWILSQPNGKIHNLPFLIEGPYGDYHHLHHYDSIILVAGGIGVTGVYPYASELVEAKERNQRALFIWTMSDESCLEWFGDQIAYLSTDIRIQKHIYLTSGKDEVKDNSRIESINNDKERSEVARNNTISVSQLEKGSPDVTDSDTTTPTRNQFIHHENTTRNRGRPDLVKIVSNEISRAQGSIAFVVCGPGPLNDVVRQTIANNIKEANARIDLFEEAFAW